MAHKKGAGSTRNGRDSESKRLGVKLFGGQQAKAGNIILRQRGTKYHPEKGVGLGKDHTIFATTDGIVYFRRRKNNRLFVSVLGEDEYNQLVNGAGADTAEAKQAAKKAAPKAKKEEAPKADAKAEKKTEAKKEEKPAAKKEAAPKKEEQKEAKADEKKETKKTAPKKKAAPKAKKDEGDKAKKEDKGGDEEE